MVDTILEICDLHAYYGKSYVIQGVSLQIGHGERVVVVGRNGMGKTTLLRAIMGLTPPWCQGSIRFKGQDISSKKTCQIVNLGLGYVPQGRQLFSSLSVDEHLRLAYYPKNNNRWTPDTVYRFFPELKNRKQVSGTRLSGGEQQMLAIARALVTNPTLLIMDEPSEGLAPLVVDRIVETCKQLVEETKLSLLVVEQNIKVINGLAERVYIMVSGRIVCQVRGEEFIADEELQHQYLGI